MVCHRVFGWVVFWGIFWNRCVRGDWGRRGDWRPLNKFLAPPTCLRPTLPKSVAAGSYRQQAYAMPGRIDGYEGACLKVSPSRGDCADYRFSNRGGQHVLGSDLNHARPARSACRQ